jgi:ketosteroid isomerase-like protein
MDKNNLNVLRNGYDSFAKGDIPAVLAIFDTDIEYTLAEGFPYGGTYIGPEAVTNEVFMKLGTEWDNFSAVPVEYIDGGNRIVALGKYSGTYKATGKSFEADFAHVWIFRDGKAIKLVQYTDTLLVQKALQE